MDSETFWVTIVVSLAIVLGMAWLGIRLYRFRLWLRQRDRRGPGPRCPQCDYDLTGAQIPRCPECGRALGFDKTFEDLGIPESDVREHVRKRTAARSRTRTSEPLTPDA